MRDMTSEDAKRETGVEQSVMVPGRVTLAATPIGNPLDASVRLHRALREADVIAAEDTRRLKRLANNLGIRLDAEVYAYHEHNERERTGALLERARQGLKVLVVTDAGMPVISDPGYRAVIAAREEGVGVDVFPGPSAPLTALVHSGLAPERFTFEGFLPRTAGKRDSALRALASERRTMIFFESPRRTAVTLEAMREAFGKDRRACVARELTKTYEDIVRGGLGELAAWAHVSEVLGEIVILVEGDSRIASPEDLVGDVLARSEAGERLKDAAKAVATDHRDVSARELYDLARAARSRD